jgi:hypothetical protein
LSNDRSRLPPCAFSRDDPRRLAEQIASTTLNGPSLRPDNANRGFELMKIVDVGASLSMMRAHVSGDDEGRFGEIRLKMHNNCG